MSQEQQTRLSQWDALLLESLRALGWSNEQLIERITKGEFPEDHSKYEFKYEPLKQLAEEQPEQLRQAIEQGYQIKFNTVGGIRSWVDVALHKTVELIEVDGLFNIKVSLTSAEQQRLASVLSYGWVIKQVDEGAGKAEGEENSSLYVITPLSQVDAI
jgi:hypothetical protein